MSRRRSRGELIAQPSTPQAVPDSPRNAVSDTQRPLMDYQPEALASRLLAISLQHRPSAEAVRRTIEHIGPDERKRLKATLLAELGRQIPDLLAGIKVSQELPRQTRSLVQMMLMLENKSDA